MRCYPGGFLHSCSALVYVLQSISRCSCCNKCPHSPCRVAATLTRTMLSENSMQKGHVPPLSLRYWFPGLAALAGSL